MKRFVSLMLVCVFAMSLLVGCGSGSGSGSSNSGGGSSGGSSAAGGKVAIVTNDVSQNEEEYRSAEQMVEKYGDRIIHTTWPDNFMTEQEQMITTVSKIAADPEVKALIINQAVPGTDAAVDKLLESRDDILIIYATPQENPEDVAVRADIILQPNELDMGPAMVQQAQKQGAKTFVHYSFPRHMAQPLLSGRRELMKAECDKLGIAFVDATAPDPTGDSGVTGAQQFILEDVPKMVAQYGKDTAFFSTNCAMQVPLIKSVVENGAIYPQPCCPSPYHGFPAALGLVSDGTSAVETMNLQDIIDQTTKILEEKGEIGRVSTWPVPVSMMITIAGTEYAFKWMAGETNGKLDLNVLKTCMDAYAGLDCQTTAYSDGTTTYDNYQLIMMDYLNYGE